MIIGNEQEVSTQSRFGTAEFSLSEMVRLTEAFGFRFSRKRGSHHIYVHPSASELLNLQEVGGKAKPYQIRQFLKLVEKYNLELRED